MEQRDIKTYDIDRHMESFTLLNLINDYQAIDIVLMSIRFKQSMHESIHVSTQEVMNVLQKSENMDKFSYISIISEFGGWAFILWMLGHLMMGPIARFSFHISAVSNLFLAKTSDHFLLNNVPKRSEKNKLWNLKEKDMKTLQTMNPKVQQKFANHRVIRMNKCDICRLVCLNIFVGSFPCFRLCCLKS